MARIGRYLLSGGGLLLGQHQQEGLRYDDPDPLFHRAAQSQEERRKEMGGELHARRAAMHRPVYRAQVLLEERRDETRSIRLERHLHARLRSRSEDRTQILHERSQRSEGHLRHTRLELLIVSRHCPSTPATEFGPSKRQCRETRRPSKRGAVLV